MSYRIFLSGITICRLDTRKTTPGMRIMEKDAVKQQYQNSRKSCLMGSSPLANYKRSMNVFLKKDENINVF